MDTDNYEITTRSIQEILFSLIMITTVTGIIVVIVVFADFGPQSASLVILSIMVLLLLGIELSEAMKKRTVIANKKLITMRINNEENFTIKWSDINDFRVEHNKNVIYFFFSHNGKIDGLSSSEIGKNNMKDLYRIIKRNIGKN
jgi:hypothetical protein